MEMVLKVEEEEMVERGEMELMVEMPSKAPSLVV